MENRQIYKERINQSVKKRLEGIISRDKLDEYEFYPVFFTNGEWMCACGKIQPDGSFCRGCGSQKEEIRQKLSKEIIMSKYPVEYGMDDLDVDMVTEQMEDNISSNVISVEEYEEKSKTYGILKNVYKALTLFFLGLFLMGNMVSCSNTDYTGIDIIRSSGKSMWGYERVCMGITIIIILVFGLFIYSLKKDTNYSFFTRTTGLNISIVITIISLISYFSHEYDFYIYNAAYVVEFTYIIICGMGIYGMYLEYKLLDHTLKPNPFVLDNIPLYILSGLNLLLLFICKNEVIYDTMIAWKLALVLLVVTCVLGIKKNRYTYVVSQILFICMIALLVTTMKFYLLFSILGSVYITNLVTFELKVFRLENIKKIMS